MVSLQQPFAAGFCGSTAPWGVRGSRTAPYCTTPETNGDTTLNSAANITSISAMPHYKDRTHEELRFEDYQLGNESSLPIQNQGNAFQQSKSPFGPVPVPSSHVKPPFGCMSTGFGVASSTQTFNSNPTPVFGGTSSACGAPLYAPSTTSIGFGTSTFKSPSASFSEGGLSSPAFNVSTTPASSSTSSTFGMCNMPPSAPSTASTGFGTSTFRSPSVSVPEGGLSFPDFNVSTSAFGSTSSSFGVPSSAPSTACSGFGTSTFRFPSASVSEGGLSSPAFNASSTPAFWSTSSTFGVPSSAPCTSSSGFGTSTFRFPSASVSEGGLSSPAVNVSSTPAFWSTSSTFGVPSSAPSTACSGCTFRFPSASVSEGGLSSPAFNVSSTPAFWSTSSTFGVPFSAPSTASSDFGTSTFRFPSASVSEGGLSSPAFNVSSTPAFCSTSSTFGIYNMPPSAPSTASTGFGTSTFKFPSAPVPGGGLSFPAFNVSTTPVFSTSSPFGVSNMPPSAPSTSSTGFGTSTFRFPVAPDTSNNPVSLSTISGFCFSSMPASGIQTSSGSLGTTAAKSQGSRVASYSATREDDPSNNKFPGWMIQSISAMPSYKDKSHEELRSEDYGLCNTGGQKLWGDRFFGPNSVKTSDTPNQSSVHAPFSPFQNHSSGPSRENFINPSNTTITAPTPSPPVNPFNFTNVFTSQSQAFTLQPDRASAMPTCFPNQNPPSSNPFTASVLKNSCECSKIPKSFTSQSAGAFSLEQPSVIIPPSIQSTSVTASDPWPSQAPSGPAIVQSTNQNINGQQYVPSSTLGVESSPVVNPFATQFTVDYAVTPRQHGISSMPVSNNLSSKRTSLMRIRHVSSRHTGLVTQKPNVRSSETKVPFFINEEDRPGPVAPFLPRENHRAWINISMSLCSLQGKGNEVKEDSIAFQIEENSTSLTDDEDSRQHHQDDVDVTPRTERRVDDVLALLPKLPDGDYYMEPSLHELAAKEMAEAGFCSHVKDFVVGRKGYGSVKFLGETDVRHLDIKSAVQFNNREMIVYPDETKKPQVGQQLNKAAEVSILNVKCIDKKTGEQYVEGHRIESYREILINKTLEQGAEFVSYDPVEGEWKFRVQHF